LRLIAAPVFGAIRSRPAIDRTDLDQVFVLRTEFSVLFLFLWQQKLRKPHEIGMARALLD